MTSVKITVNIDNNRREKFKKAVNKNDSTMNREILLFIDSYIKNPKKYKRELV